MRWYEVFSIVTLGALILGAFVVLVGSVADGGFVGLILGLWVVLTVFMLPTVVFGLTQLLYFFIFRPTNSWIRASGASLSFLLFVCVLITSLHAALPNIRLPILGYVRQDDDPDLYARLTEISDYAESLAFLCVPFLIGLFSVALYLQNENKKRKR